MNQPSCVRKGYRRIMLKISYRNGQMILRSNTVEVVSTSAFIYNSFFPRLGQDFDRAERG
jgi:hypothetical protein